MEFDDVRTFVAIADAGSISEAARQLFVTQPAVTRRLQRLEHTLGTALVDRRRRPFVPTPAGQAILEKCRHLLRSVRDVQAAIDPQGPPVGELRIGVAHALTEIALAAPLDRLRRRFSRVELQLTTGWSRVLLDQVRLGSLDAAVILLPKDEPLPVGIRGVAVGAEQLVIVAAAGKERVARRAADLGHISWILNPEGCAARASLRRALRRAGVELRVALETYNYDLQLSLVAKRRGWSLVPSRILSRSRVRGKLRPVRIEDLQFPLTVWTVMAADHASLSTVIDEFNRHLTSSLSSRTAA